MHRPRSQTKAVAMLSGGLDSTLALGVILDQGIAVQGVNFSTGFCRTDHRRQMGAQGTDPHKLRNQALKVGGDFAVPVEVIDISREYLGILRHPRHGYGRNVNPCIDCRILMMQRARELMLRVGADFVFTGEVLGQRPKSQHRRAMNIVAEESGLGDRLLRPLSARLLAPTWPERLGVVDRDCLFAFSGRDRNPQLELAKRIGIGAFQQPAGGCCSLTDEGFANRVFDLFQHVGKDELSADDLALCKVGRHFRVSPAAKVVVARSGDESRILRNYGLSRPRLEPIDHHGPVGVIDAPRLLSPREDLVLLAAGVIARYSSGKRESLVRVRYLRGGEDRVLEVRPLGPQQVEAWLLR